MLKSKPLLFYVTSTIWLKEGSFQTKKSFACFKNMEPIHNLRKEYIKNTICDNELDNDPFVQFHVWFSEAVSRGVSEPNAMSLSTVSDIGRPSSRIVLLKSYEKSQFSFFTNYESRKGKQLSESSYAALLFFWHELEKQVRIEGLVERLSEHESEQYFHSRPYGSQIGALVSMQSSEILDRKQIEHNYQTLFEEYKGITVPKPTGWGGYALKPTLIEFWQGRANRLHDRIEYNLIDGAWQKRRLSP